MADDRLWAPPLALGAHVRAVRPAAASGAPRSVVARFCVSPKTGQRCTLKVVKHCLGNVLLQEFLKKGLVVAKIEAKMKCHESMVRGELPSPQAEALAHSCNRRLHKKSKRHNIGEHEKQVLNSHCLFSGMFH